MDVHRRAFLVSLFKKVKVDVDVDVYRQTRLPGFKGKSQRWMWMWMFADRKNSKEGKDENDTVLVFFCHPAGKGLVFPET